MLTISTIPESLEQLAKQTGQAWTDSELFDLVTRHGIELHAAAPISAQTTIQKFVDGVGLVEKFRSSPGHSPLAVLFPWQVGQIWLSGETMASHTGTHDAIDGEHQWFIAPVCVTREQVRIKAATLKKILAAWQGTQLNPAQTATTPEQAATPEAVADSDWMTQAQTRAREIVKESKEVDRYPSQENLGDQIASEFRKAGIVGADGKPLTGSTIKRHALKGISSATGKQLSTTIGRGK